MKYNVTLANATNNFLGAVASNGLNVTLEDKTGGIVLGNTTATGALAVTSLGGNIIQAATHDDPVSAERARSRRTLELTGASETRASP